MPGKVSASKKCDSESDDDDDDEDEDDDDSSGSEDSRPEVVGRVQLLCVQDCLHAHGRYTLEESLAMTR